MSQRRVGYSPREGILSRDCESHRDGDNPSYDDLTMLGMVSILRMVAGPVTVGSCFDHPRNGDSPMDYDHLEDGNTPRT